MAPLLDVQPTDGRANLMRLRQSMSHLAQAMPRHDEFIDKFLALISAEPKTPTLSEGGVGVGQA